MSAGQWRVDSLSHGNLRNAPTTWHDGDEDAAKAEASRLRFDGKTSAVAWCDWANYESEGIA